MSGGNRGDLTTGFIEPLAVAVVCELLQVPKALRRKVSELSELLESSEGTPEKLIAAVVDFAELIREIAAAGTNDLVVKLDGLSDQDIEIMFVTLLTAGRNSPTTFLSSAIFALLREPGKYGHLVDHPETIDNAVEELLRYTPVRVDGGFSRVALQDTKLGSVEIRAGEVVVPAMHAANRDAAVFARPEELLLDRTVSQHFGLGHGAHYCVGAALARLEIGIAVHSLTQRLPALRLATPAADIPWRPGPFRVLESLEVMW
ncbi:cytochrome P450 [Nocardia sp. NPDC051052]|uniref:cytochrome P450 n=1 Tax=Nocardia sp. NPDC051052 TaxID=3364322 RepID=UPI0037B1AF88